MVFVAGPRQVGKTFMSKQIMSSFQKPIYLNYDNREDREIIEHEAWLESTDLLVLDELHKMSGWKNYLKGIYDTKPDHLHILVTGSARLDIFDKAGDSLAGRYFLHRVLPLSPSELHQLKEPVKLERLITRGGFPEPYLAEDDTEAARWRLQYTASLLGTDVFEFDKIQNLRAIKTLFELLQWRVGSSISYQALAEDVGVSPSTIKKYIEVLEALYVIFRVTPYSKNIARSLLKEPKVYFFDTGLVKASEGTQLENLVAVCLLKHVYAKTDYHAENYQLHYLKNKEGLEVDFALAKDQHVQKIIEVKTSGSELSKSLYFYHKKYEFPAVQIVKNLRQERLVDDIKILKLENFLSELFL